MTKKSRSLKLVVNKAENSFVLSGVYLITDLGENLVERVATALRGGVSVLQYRPKEKSSDECRAEGAKLHELCKRAHVPFIINDNVALAIELDADGVHLGQDDGDTQEARRILGPDKIIGKSTHSLEEALQAEQEGADYIGFGAMYPTGSKSVSHIPGTTGLSAIRSRIQLPVVAIGGITTDNACRVIDAGADALAVISAVLSSPRPDTAVTELKLLFNRKRAFPRGTVLTIAGSDSGGGAGIQADLKTITLLGSYGASVITALTAQNTKGVNGIHGLPSSFVLDQLDTVLSDIPVDVIKTGMLHTPAIISALAEYLGERKQRIPLVVDPVMIAKGGAPLLEREAIRQFREQLVPLAYLLTPNLPEAERLLGYQLHSETDVERAARELHAMGAARVLIKGGHQTGQMATDILFDGTGIHHFSSPRLFTTNTHGTGCTLASAIATYLAQGEPLLSAVEKAKQYISAAIRLARPLGKGHSPVNHYAAAHETT